MAALQPAGVRAVAEGVDKYVGDMKRMGGATADMGSRLSQMATIAGGMIASQVFTRLADAFMSVARGAVEFGKEAVLTAARVQELDAVLLTIGRNAGIPKSELDELVESIKDLEQGSVEDIVAIKGVNEKLATDIHAYFHPDEDGDEENSDNDKKEK